MRAECGGCAHAVRECRASDAPLIYSVELSSFKPHDIYSPEILKFLCAYCGDSSYVYLACNDVVGYIITCIEGGAAHVISLAVRPEYRRRGIGRALLCTALNLLARGRVSEVFLEVRVSNEPALRLYTSAGFTISEVLRGYYGDGEDGYRLRLRDREAARRFCTGRRAAC
jgi:ribosomal-protein-alanine N-acetyltransferase